MGWFLRSKKIFFLIFIVAFSVFSFWLVNYSFAQEFDQDKINYCVNLIIKACPNGCLAGSQNDYIISCEGQVSAVFGENLSNDEKNEVARITASYFTVQPGQPGAPGSPGAPAAPGQPCDPNSNQLCNPLQAKNFGELINIIINFLFWIAIVAGPLMILVAAFMFLSSGGNAQKLATAKNIIIYTAVGIAVALLAKGLISVVKSVFSG